MFRDTQIFIHRRFLFNNNCRFIDSIRIWSIKDMLISSIKLIYGMIVNYFVFDFENLHLIIFLSSKENVTDTHTPRIHTLFIPTKTKIFTSSNSCNLFWNWNFGEGFYIKIVCAWLFLFVWLIILSIDLFLILLYLLIDLILKLKLSLFLNCIFCCLIYHLLILRVLLIFNFFLFIKVILFFTFFIFFIFRTFIILS